MITDANAALYRDERLVVISLDANNVGALNDSIASVYSDVVASNPGATRVSEVDAAIGVQDLETGSFHLLVVHRIDYRPDRVATTGDVVVFSEPGFAPTCAAELQLATPGYYRREETLEPGIGDESDGSPTKDASPWLARKLGGHIRNVKASIRLVSAREPWVYCAAHHRDARDLQRLRTRFSEEYGYTAATAILDADDFAMWLGIDFALTFDEAAHVSLGETEAAMLARARYSIPVGGPRGHHRHRGPYPPRPRPLRGPIRGHRLAGGLRRPVRRSEGLVHEEDGSGMAVRVPLRRRHHAWAPRSNPGATFQSRRRCGHSRVRCSPSPSPTGPGRRRIPTTSHRVVPRALPRLGWCWWTPRPERSLWARWGAFAVRGIIR